MPSPEAAAVFKANQDLLAAWSTPDLGIGDFRSIFEDFLAGLALDPDVEFTDVDARGVPAIWCDGPGTNTGRVVIHFHSGGLVMGSAKGYRSFGGNLAEATGYRVLLVDYRLAPEYPFPAQLDDVLAVYRWVQAGGVAASNIVICGDSGGGGLGLALLLALRDKGEALPAAGVAMSPLTDWTLSGESLVYNAANDPLVPGPDLLAMIKPMVLIDPADATNPYASPLFGDYTGLPPLLILGGLIEALRDDGFRVIAKAQTAGVDATFLEGEGMVHIWPIFADRLPEARTALTQIATFIHKHT